ncbi:uncharacterized protein LOC130805959 [Amaranthus tricolor]|uniref:uncharacterized protein LOC130805959 n=1 Tax=Amaranthus tricolor TaxID=29722 RepID=UPI0025825A22|nr:uncharacterized protein LOC130805959 [Amaranthus tricolor]
MKPCTTATAAASLTHSHALQQPALSLPPSTAATSRSQLLLSVLPPSTSSPRQQHSRLRVLQQQPADLCTASRSVATWWLLHHPTRPSIVIHHYNLHLPPSSLLLVSSLFQIHKRKVELNWVIFVTLGCAVTLAAGGS